MPDSDGDQMTSDFIAGQWATLCRSARSNATRLSEGASSKAAEFIDTELGRFCEVEPPFDKESLESAYTQRMALSARLTAISRADAMAQAHPVAAPEIHSRLGQFCQDDLPHTSDAFLDMQLQNIELTKAVVAICRSNHGK